MKRLFQISVLLNIVLLAMTAWRTAHRTAPSATVPNISDAATRSSPKWTARSASVPAAALPWKKIETADLSQFVANLRAVGCPEPTLRAIVALHVCRQFRERLIAAESEAARALPLTRNRSQASWDESNQLQRDLRNEMITTIESLLGEPWDSLFTSLAGMPPSDNDWMASWSGDKRREVRELETRYSRLDAELNHADMEARGTDPEILAGRRELEKKKFAELAGILSPSELQDYIYRRSAAADYVRTSGPAARSEAEFRAMVDLANEFGMARPSHWSSVPGESENAATRAFNEQKSAFEQRLKEMLGDQRLTEERAADQARAGQQQKQQQEQDFQHERERLVETAGSVGVSAESANRFVDRLREAQKTLDPKFREMEKNLTGTPEEKQKQMNAAVKAELQKIAVETMGEKGRALVDKMLESDH